MPWAVNVMPYIYRRSSYNVVGGFLHSAFCILHIRNPRSLHQIRMRCRPLFALLSVVKDRGVNAMFASYCVTFLNPCNPFQITIHSQRQKAWIRYPPYLVIPLVLNNWLLYCEAQFASDMTMMRWNSISQVSDLVFLQVGVYIHGRRNVTTPSLSEEA